ncbi:MAG: hypothetical protein IKO02_03915 [Lentisphaeria bacterium]|nr:hypothetical protein [Lentisphaeria bacterium]
MEWVYYDYMGDMNPVCKDVGTIKRIIPNYPGVQYTYSNILEIETDKGRFSCDTKFDIVRLGGFCIFELNGDLSQPLKFIKLDEIKHGDIVELHQNDVLQIGGYSLTPITTDPRVLCIMHRAHDDLPLNPTKAQFNKFCKHIPDMEEAIDYLTRKRAQMDCRPMAEVSRLLSEEGK